jgi:hypothetical protein
MKIQIKIMNPKVTQKRTQLLKPQQQQQQQQHHQQQKH